VEGNKLILGEANYDGNYPYNDNELGIYYGLPLPPYLYGESSNDFGLIAMHGNLEEWCWDWYGAYEGVSVENPTGPERGMFKVVRGGSYQEGGRYLRSASRWASLPDEEESGYVGVPWIGFRIVRNAPSEPGGPDTRTVIGRSGTAKRALKLLPQGMPQGKRTFERQIDKNSLLSAKSPAFRKKGAEE
jgi:hypothetical protein